MRLLALEHGIHATARGARQLKPMFRKPVWCVEHEILPHAWTERHEAANRYSVVIIFCNPLRAGHCEVADRGAVNAVRFASERLKLIALILWQSEAHVDEIEQSRICVNLDHPVVPPPFTSIR